MYNQKFVLSIIHDGRPVKESGSGSNRQVAIPFGSEYKIRLKNKNDRDCTARVLVDGVPVSNFGDIIVSAGGTVDLERFITNSMSSGKRFKFVELDNPNVDDPTKSENGVVRVEFRLYIPPFNNFKYHENNDGMWYIGDASYLDFSSGSNGVRTFKNGGVINDPRDTVKYCSTNISSTQPGATIEGRKSNQSFSHIWLDVESTKTIIQLKIVGIKHSFNNEVTANSTKTSYCTKCGYKIKDSDRYCGGCGRKL